jgi:ubiquinone/menaquinone biosynthesis C-methylase UbiE
MDLSENSTSYGRNAAVYDHFSQCEDSDGEVERFLEAYSEGQLVLDCGCGGGRFLRTLTQYSAGYIGLERSAAQLEICARRSRSAWGARLVRCDLSAIPIDSQSVDLAIACWVLGTILDEKKRQSAFSEMLRVIRPGGRLLFIENDTGGEFERVRGRFPDISRTQIYNDWLIARGCRVVRRLVTSFRFPSLQSAQETFSAIWGSEVGGRVTSASIPHSVIALEWMS